MPNRPCRSKNLSPTKKELRALRRRALALVNQERDFQDKRWGIQSHPPIRWLTILGEEFGESCKAVLEHGECLDPRKSSELATNARDEIVQVAAVAIAFLEWMDRVRFTPQS